MPIIDDNFFQYWLETLSILLDAENILRAATESGDLNKIAMAQKGVTSAVAAYNEIVERSDQSNSLMV